MLPPQMYAGTRAYAPWGVRCSARRRADVWQKTHVESWVASTTKD